MLALFPASEFERQPDLQLVLAFFPWAAADWDTLFDAAQRAAAGYARAATPL